MYTYVLDSTELSIFSMSSRSWGLGLELSDGALA